MSHGTYKTLTLKLFDKRETQDACLTDACRQTCVHTQIYVDGYMKRSWNESWHI